MTTETIRDVRSHRDDTATRHISWPSSKIIPSGHDCISAYLVPEDVSAETYESLNTELIDHPSDSPGSAWSVSGILQSRRSGTLVLIEGISALVGDLVASFDFREAQHTQSEQVEQIWSRFPDMWISHNELDRKVLTVQTSRPTVSDQRLIESLHATTLLFAEGFNDAKPSMTTLAKADRVVRAALEEAGRAEIDVDEVSGALSFDLRLSDGRLLLAELEIDGGLTADLFDDSGGEITWVKHFPNPSSRDLIALF